MTERRQTTQPVAWFWDLYRRGMLIMDPPYQRRSVWSQTYKDYFIDTVLLDYPAPAVFLYEEIDEMGSARYSVVDGKQRLSALFEFLGNTFPISDSATLESHRGIYFKDLPPEINKRVFRYQFSIEFLPTVDESALSNIFDRINRNVARLTPQELRHAKYEGIFATKVEQVALFMDEIFPKGFPRIASTSKRQMKDSELVAQLLLLAERGVHTYSQSDLDVAYSERDDEWEDGERVTAEACEVFRVMARWAPSLSSAAFRRLRNQSDFYSLFGAVRTLLRDERLPLDAVAVASLNVAMETVDDEDSRQQDANAKRYYEATRSASNDVAQRRDREDFLKSVLLQGR